MDCNRKTFAGLQPHHKRIAEMGRSLLCVSESRTNALVKIRSGLEEEVLVR